jgi:hypothetical protein
MGRGDALRFGKALSPDRMKRDVRARRRVNPAQTPVRVAKRGKPADRPGNQDESPSFNREKGPPGPKREDKARIPRVRGRETDAGLVLRDGRRIFWELRPG